MIYSNHSTILYMKESYWRTWLKREGKPSISLSLFNIISYASIPGPGFNGLLCLWSFSKFLSFILVSCICQNRKHCMSKESHVFTGTLWGTVWISSTHYLCLWSQPEVPRGPWMHWWGYSERLGLGWFQKNGLGRRLLLL